MDSNNGRPGQDAAAVDTDQGSVCPGTDSALGLSQLDAAFFNADRFGPVFPLDHPSAARCVGLHSLQNPCDDKRGKHPAVKWSTEATVEPGRLNIQFSAGQPRNIGLACGPAGLLVVDEDEPGAFAAYAASIGQVIPATYMVTTGRGRHYYFKQDGSLGNAEGALKDWPVNLRGRGGYVVAAGSQHESGLTYLADDPSADVAHVPHWLKEAIGRRPKSTQKDRRRDRVAPLGRFTGVSVHRGPIPRERHNTLVSYAGTLLSQGVPLPAAEDLMRARWLDVAQPDGDPYPLDQALSDLWDVFGRYGTTPAREQAAQESAVQRELDLLRAREQAKEILRLEKAGLAVYPPVVSLTEFLSTCDEPVTYRVEDLWPVGGRVVLAAQHKAGKSTLRDNLVRALVDSAPFLGQFYVAPFQGQIVLIDDELDERMLRRWLRGQGIRHPHRVHVVSLRGRVGSFDLTSDVVRARWAEQFQQIGAAVIILDCLRPVLDALSLSEDKEAGRFLVGFDALLAESGAGEGMIVHHMGHSGERSRGDTRLRDWPDVEWQLVREGAHGEQQPDARRFFKAYGRDVNVPEGLLEYDEDTRRLCLAGGSRKQEAAGDLIAEVMGYLDAHPGATGRGIDEALQSLGRNGVRDALKQAVRDGRVRTQPGPRRAKFHFNVNSDEGDGGSAPSAPQCAGALR